MISFKGTKLKLINSLSKYYADMSEIDRAKLIINSFQYTTEHTTWDHFYEFENNQGFITLNDDKEGSVSISVYAVPEFRGSLKIGYGLMAIMFYAFDYLSAVRVGSTAVSFNDESLAFQNRWLIKEGVRRKRIRFNNQYYDQILYGLLKEEFEEKFSKYRKHFKID